jgi:chromatin remodeling complex protein RSC6
MSSFTENKSMIISKKFACFLDIDHKEEYTPDDIMRIIMNKCFIYDKERIDYLKTLETTPELTNFLRQIEDNDTIVENDYMYCKNYSHMIGISRDFADFLGIYHETKLSYADFIELVKDYINENKLADGRYITPDEKLATLLNTTEPLTLTEIRKKLFPHFTGKDLARPRYNPDYLDTFYDEERFLSYDVFTKLFNITNEMADFVQLPHGTKILFVDYNKLITKYIHENNLSDGRNINPDERLTTLLGYNPAVEQLTWFNIQRYLSPKILRLKDYFEE